jgi:hypothetical protein
VSSEVIEGTVERVNERGVRLNGAWYNLSQFRTVPLPQQGARVRLSVDTKGFILDSTPLDETATPDVLSDRDLRLSVLEAAVRFAASRPDMKSADVLTLADRWLEWVNQ